MQSFVDSFYSSSSRFISKEGRKEGDSSKYFSRRKRRKRRRRGIVENFIGNPERWLNHSIDFPSRSPSLFFFQGRKRSIFVGWKKSGLQERGRRRVGSKGDAESSYALMNEEVSISITMYNRISIGSVPFSRVLQQGWIKDKDLFLFFSFSLQTYELWNCKNSTRLG